MAKVNRIHTAASVAVAVVAVAAALIYTQSVMIPFVLAVFIAFIAAPSVVFFQTKCRMPRSIALLTTALGVALVLACFAGLLSGTVKNAMGNIDTYREKLQHLADQSTTWISRMGLELNREQIQESLRKLPIFNFARSLVGKLGAMLADTFLVIVFVLFLLSGRSFGLPQNGVWREMDKRVRAYLVTKAITSVVTGMATWIILQILGLDMAFMFGVAAFLLNFIPTVGSIIAVLLPVPIALLQFDEIWRIGLSIGLPGGVQFLVGNIIEPKVMGDSLDLHPATILIALMFWGLIWGIAGMILAAPLTVIIKLMLERIQGGKVFAEVMAGRFPKSATESQ